MKNFLYNYRRMLSLFTNVFLFYINIFLLFKNKKKKKQILLIFKNIDIIIFNFALNSYLEISSYLNKKYRIRGNLNREKLKKTIKIYAIDVYSFFDLNKFIKITDKFIFKKDRNNPDYLFYSTVGNKHLNPKYDNAYCQRKYFKKIKVIKNFQSHHILKFVLYLKIVLLILIKQIIVQGIILLFIWIDI